MKKEEIALGFLVRRAYFSMRRSLEAELSLLNLTAEQYSVLLVLKDSAEGLIQKEVSELLFIDQNTLVGIVKRLLIKEWIIRHKDSKDARSYRIRLSKRGEEKLEEAIVIAKKIRKLAARGMSEQEKDAFAEALKKVYENFKDVSH